MSQPFIGEIRLFGGNFQIRGWAFCDGRLLPISGNDALFNLIGTTYGGDGQSTFALPDLRGRVPVHMGQGPGLSSYIIGQNGGAETVTLTTNTMPAHTHTPTCNGAGPSSTNPNNTVWANSANDVSYTAPAGITGQMNAQAAGPNGGNQPHENMLPYQAINYIIALEGVFPSRN